MAETPVSEIEATLLQIPGVRAARMITDPDGKPVEVHIVAGTEKAPKQIVRDIQTVSVAHFGIQLDHRIVSVVQFPEAKVTTAAETRPSIEGIATEVSGTSAQVTVTLRKRGATVTGEASGANSKESLLRLAAAAALDALEKLLADGTRFSLEHVAVQRSGAGDIALATLTLTGSPGAMSLSGSAMVTGLPTEAVVRAALDALNRRLWRGD